MSYLTTAFIVAVIGCLPLAFRKKFGAAVILGIISFLITWWVLYSVVASTIWPLWGLPGFCVGITWLIAAFVDGAERQEVTWAAALPTLYAIILIGSGFVGSKVLNADRYASLLGPVEERDWTQDVQPKDPKHMRMVSEENALYIAQKAVANAGAIGSQFMLDWDYVTLQKVKDRLAYVIPFDFGGFSAWQQSSGSPAFIIVDAEDPERLPQLVELPAGKRLRYTPGAYFGDNLERMMRQNGYLDDGLAAPRFELDDEGNPHWIVALYQPTITWSGEKVTGVAVVDPVTGSIDRYTTANAPEWIDRIYPSSLIEHNIDLHGHYFGGWWNSFWGQKGLTEAEPPILVQGSDSAAEWVTGITSAGPDDSLIGLMYTNSRTGKTVYYKTNGGATDTAILHAVNANQQVQYKHLHGSTPQIYNVYGVMSSVVPLLNDNHAYQGVAIVKVSNPQDVAVGATQSEALRAYQTLIFRKGQQTALEKEQEVQTLTGVVDRISQDLSANGGVYYFHLVDTPRFFTISSSEYVKIILTHPGDTVKVTYVASGEDVVPIQEFDNISLPLERTAAQEEVATTATVKFQAEATRANADDMVKRIKVMSPEELKRLGDAIKADKAKNR